MPTDQTFVIVGAGLAGAKAAETLRERGLRRPRGPARRRGRAPLRAPAAVQGLPARRGRAHEALRPRRRLLRGAATSSCAPRPRSSRSTPTPPRSSSPAASGIGYDRLLIATGAEPRRLDVPGADLDGVHYLRTRRRLRRDRASGSRRGGKLVTIGAGWIGAEVAASARQKGCEVTVLEMAARAAGARARAGARRHLPRHPHRPRRRAPRRDRPRGLRGRGSVESVRTADGRAIDADFVVVGVGVAPRTQLAEAAGLEVENGILADRAPRDERAGCLRRRRRRQRHPPPLRSAGSASSTGPTRSTRARRPRATCSARTPRTTRFRTSSRTSTTSEWSTRATRRTGTRSYSAATSTPASSSPSGSATAASSLA